MKRKDFLKRSIVAGAGMGIALTSLGKVLNEAEKVLAALCQDPTLKLADQAAYRLGLIAYQQKDYRTALARWAGAGRCLSVAASLGFPRSGGERARVVLGLVRPSLLRGVAGGIGGAAQLGHLKR